MRPTYIPGYNCWKTWFSTLFSCHRYTTIPILKKTYSFVFRGCILPFSNIKTRNCNNNFFIFSSSNCYCFMYTLLLCDRAEKMSAHVTELLGETGRYKVFFAAFFGECSRMKLWCSKYICTPVTGRSVAKVLSLAVLSTF